MLNSIRSTAFNRLQGKFFYGWVILGVAMLGMFGTGPGQSHLIGIFFDPLSLELELTRTSIAAAYGSATLVAALLLAAVQFFKEVLDRLPVVLTTCYDATYHPRPPELAETNQNRQN